MITNTPPHRWLDDESSALPGKLERGLRAYAQQQPDTEQQARIWQRLSEAAAAAAGPDMDPPVAVPAATWPLWYKAAGLMLVGIALALLWSVYRTQSRELAQTGASGRKLSVVARPAAPSVVGEPAAVPQHTAAMAQPVAAPVVATFARLARARASRRMPPGTASATLKVQSADPELELALLTRARRVLYSAPQRALVLAQTHARDYPHGVFVEEREAIAIQALARLGRHEEASSRARVFLREHPRSAHAQSIRSLLEAQ